MSCQYCNCAQCRASRMQVPLPPLPAGPLPYTAPAPPYFSVDPIGVPAAPLTVIPISESELTKLCHDAGV
jgi:hypothetical protein